MTADRPTSIPCANLLSPASAAGFFRDTLNYNLNPADIFLCLSFSPPGLGDIPGNDGSRCAAM